MFTLPLTFELLICILIMIYTNKNQVFKILAYKLVNRVKVFIFNYIFLTMC